MTSLANRASWIPAFAGMTMGVALSVLRHSRERGNPGLQGKLPLVPRLVALGLLPIFVSFFSIENVARAQDEDSRKILAFALAWRGPQDYVWTRESVTKRNSKDKRGIRMKDFGRIRIEMLSYENESVVLDPHILRYRYETEFPGEPVEKKTSPLEGVDLPPVWFHSVMGVSIGLEPGSGEGVRHTQQAGEVLEILDFRGFVPDATPVQGKKWTARSLREADSTYAFTESVEREFECLEVVRKEENTLCKVRFEELVKVTPRNPSRSSEIRERTGTYEVRMPQGLIENSAWRTLSTEYLQTKGSRRKIATEITAHIQRRDASPSKPRKQRKESGERERTLPKPPR